MSQRSFTHLFQCSERWGWVVAALTCSMQYLSLSQTHTRARYVWMGDLAKKWKFLVLNVLHVLRLEWPWCRRQQADCWLHLVVKYKNCSSSIRPQEFWKKLQKKTKNNDNNNNKKKNSPSSTITKCRQIITYWAENRMKLAEETGTNLTTRFLFNRPIQ